jgi:hypothetical protein
MQAQHGCRGRAGVAPRRQHGHPLRGQITGQSAGRSGPSAAASHRSSTPPGEQSGLHGAQSDQGGRRARRRAEHFIAQPVSTAANRAIDWAGRSRRSSDPQVGDVRGVVVHVGDRGELWWREVTAACGQEGDEVAFWQHRPGPLCGRGPGARLGRAQLAVEVPHANPLDLLPGCTSQRGDRGRRIAAACPYKPQRRAEVGGQAAEGASWAPVSRCALSASRSVTRCLQAKPGRNSGLVTRRSPCRWSYRLRSERGARSCGTYRKCGPAWLGWLCIRSAGFRSAVGRSDRTEARLPGTPGHRSHRSTRIRNGCGSYVGAVGRSGAMARCPRRQLRSGSQGRTRMLAHTPGRWCCRRGK